MSLFFFNRSADRIDYDFEYSAQKDPDVLAAGHLVLRYFRC
jgi:hypothetical protein